MTLLLHLCKDCFYLHTDEQDFHSRHLAALSELLSVCLQCHSKLALCGFVFPASISAALGSEGAAPVPGAGVNRGLGAHGMTGNSSKHKPHSFMNS